MGKDIIAFEAQKKLEENFAPAEELLRNPDEFEKFLQRLEEKLKLIPGVGDTLAMLPILISLVKSYVEKKYTEIPVGSIVAVVGALLYFLSPIDVIPDVIPGIGHADDAAVIGVCLLMVKSDVDEYVEWREARKMTIDVEGQVE